ncbi:MAG: DNA repair and recombination protein RadA [Desulfurococcales archaeon ex4484_217_1]|nr:MAG: DNA repair and recombination protein RadA [Desulfurococcales archaeon ex4484_217_1]
MPKKIKDISELPGVGRSTAAKLTEAGYSTLEAIAVASPQELSTAVGIPLATAQRIIRAAREALDLRLKTALELKRERASVRKITTSSKNLDALLGGGVETRTITEFFGEYGTGKTQLCHQLSVNVQLPPEKGGLSGKAVYVDSEGTFRWERIESMARALGLDPDEVMANIFYVRAVNSDHQMAIVDELFELVPKENIKLIVIDSVTGHFRAEYIGREHLAQRQQKLNKHLHQLMRLAEIYNVAVVVTNQVMARPDVFYGDPTRAVGGHVLYHAPGVRVQLRRSRGNRRIARVVDAPHLPEGETIFVITEEGIRDPAE